MSNDMIWVIIAASGVGARVQSTCPKQYLHVAGKTVIEHTLDRFLHRSDIAGIVVVISATDTYWKELAIRNVHTTFGGKERADSVLNGLLFLKNTLGISPNAWVMVHDCARPCVPQADIDALCLQGTQVESGAILATPVRDTMKRVSPDSNCVVSTEDRTTLWHALTPQLARLGLLTDALSTALSQGLPITDESSALEAAGLSPLVVEGDARNIKITRKTDLELAEFFLTADCLAPQN